MFGFRSLIPIYVCLAIAWWLALVSPVWWCPHVFSLLAFGVAFEFHLAEHEATIVRFGNLVWTMPDFVRGWLITGRTGSGKTAAAIVRLLSQLFARVENWGGLCIDDKGLFWEVLGKIARHFKQQDRLVLLQVRPESARPEWKPGATYNLLSDSRIPASAYAKIIIDVGNSLGGGAGKDFFATQAQIHIEKGIEILRLADAWVTLTNLYHFLSDSNDMKLLLKTAAEIKTPEAISLVLHFEQNFLGQPPEQLGGVRSTIFNYLHYFAQPDIAAVFCPSEESTFDFDQIDQGKIVCVSMPNKFQVERRYINTFLKLAYYAHALRRFDRDVEARARDNLLVLIADEAQQIVTAAESGMSDHNVIDKIREARATVVFATQSTTSFVPTLGNQDKANVLLLNLSNRIYFTVADDPAAELAACHIGKHTVQRKSRSTGRGGSSFSYSESDEFRIKPQVLRALKKFEAIVCHCERGLRRLNLKPTSFTR
jgi:hypothetical protein